MKNWSHEARTVIVPSFLAIRLAAHVEEMSPDQLVFSAPKGGPLRTSNFRRGTNRGPRRAKSSTKTWSTNTLLAMITDEDRAILDFEGRWWLEPGPKDQAIEFTLGLSAEAYYERLIAIVAVAESSRIYPLTVARIKAMIQPDRAEEAAVS